MTKCFKAVFSHIQIPTDIDSVLTINKSRSTAHTEPLLTLAIEMVQLYQMVIKEEKSITTQAMLQDHIPIPQLLKPNLMLVDKQEDMLFHIQILIMNNQETCTECLTRDKKMPSPQILLEQWDHAEMTSKRL